MDKDFFRLETRHFRIEGRSRAGHETWFRIRDLGLALDIGRCPDPVVPMSNVFISHLHLDHAAGLAFWAGQRRLQGLEGGTVHVPGEVAADVRRLLALQETLTGATFEVEVRGLDAGEEVRVGRKHLVRAHAASHRVAARAFEVIELRHHLRPELAGQPPGVIARLRREGEPVEEEHPSPLLFYTGDTDRGIFSVGRAMFQAEVLMIECSFLGEGHQERATRYRHIHVDDIAEHASEFENEMIVLTHFSRRYSFDEIRRLARRRLPVSLQSRVRLALPEGWQEL
ncbi:MAG TPA: MBL fold metallo-hydrolase [Thermoanaerobaculia bacterium]